MKAAREKFGLERLDVLVNVVEEGREADLEGLRRLSGVVGREMERERRGSVVNVLDNVGGVEETNSEPVVGGSGAAMASS